MLRSGEGRRPRQDQDRAGALLRQGNAGVLPRLPVVALSRPFEALCKKAEVRQIPVHDLRHSCATLLFAMGVDAATVQRILLHSSITATTGTYIDVIERVQRDALDGMNAFIDPDDKSENESTA